MTIDFIRFKATDGVELPGWLTNKDSDVAAIHVHGMSGNGYENYFLDNLRDMYAKHNISFFTIDTRGRGIISDFRQGDGWKRGGSCFELFEESAHDIQGAIDYLKSIGKTKFILQGHSLGCTKVVNFVLNQPDEAVQKVIVLAPTDMAGWGKHTDTRYDEYIAKARQLVADGKPDVILDAECGYDKTPLSAATYLSIQEPGTPVDIYGDREGGALLGRVDLPMLIAYGDDDIGIVKIDGTIDKWQERVSKFKNPNTEITIIKGAAHGFRGYESQLAGIVEEFVEQ